MPTTVPIALIIGFLTGILVNLIADYLPARRHHQLASANPFVSKSVIPPVAPFIPHRPDGRVWPIYLWSGVIATLAGARVFEQHRVRHIITEIALALGF